MDNLFWKGVGVLALGGMFILCCIPIYLLLVDPLAPVEPGERERLPFNRLACQIHLFQRCVARQDVDEWARHVRSVRQRGSGWIIR